MYRWGTRTGNVMKKANVGNVLVDPSATSPKYAFCPTCGGEMILANSNGYYYTHISGKQGYLCFLSSKEK